MAAGALDARTALTLVAARAASHLCASLPAQLVSCGVADTFRRRELMTLLVDAWASAALHASLLALACAGGRGCLYGGWMPGLLLGVLPPSRRVEVTLRLSYHAVFALLDASQRAVRACDPAVGRAVRALASAVDVAMLSASTAVVLREHARAAAEQATGQHGLRMGGVAPDGGPFATATLAAPPNAHAASAAHGAPRPPPSLVECARINSKPARLRLRVLAV